jgi:hypothetical protein
MSVQAITWALSVRAGSPGAKAVLLALANYANEFAVCWPSQERLAEETDQSVDSVQRRLKELEIARLISRQERGLRNGRRALTVYSCLMPGVAGSHATTPQPAAPQSAAPQIKPNDTAALRQEPLGEPLIDSEANASDADASRDVRTRLFNHGLRTLAAITGKTPDSCRSLIGKWLKAVNDEAIHVLGAIEDAERNRIADPVAWIGRALQARSGNGTNFNGKRTIQQTASDLVVKMRAITGAGASCGREGENSFRRLPSR